ELRDLLAAERAREHVVAGRDGELGTRRLVLDVLPDLGDDRRRIVRGIVGRRRSGVAHDREAQLADRAAACIDELGIGVLAIAGWTAVVERMTAVGRARGEERQ